MASVGHVAVGLATARARHHARPAWQPALFWSALALLPDLDFLSRPLGFHDGNVWWHRGALHSFAFAALCGVAAAILARRRSSRPLVFGIVVALVVATHPVLDAMTDHGIGCMLFWPFDTTRYFLPWRVVPTIPTFADLYTIVAWQVAGREALVFTPLWIFAAWPRRRV